MPKHHSVDLFGIIAFAALVVFCGAAAYCVVRMFRRGVKRGPVPEAAAFAATLPSEFASIYLDVLDRPNGPDDDVDVEMTFHTWSRGELWNFVQTEHTLRAPAGKARELLRRLNRYNFEHITFYRGALFTPFVSLGNLWSVRRHIARQVRLARQTRSH